MLKWVLAVMFFCISLTLYFVVQEGVRPKPIREINATSFDNLEQVGASIYRRLYLEMFESDIVVVGSSPMVRGFERIWSGLLKTGEGYKKNFDIIISQEALPKISEKLVIEDMKSYESLVERVKQAKSENKKVLLHITNNESSHLIPNSIVSRLLKEDNLRVVSYTQGPFGITKNIAAQLEPACNDGSVLSELNCRAITSGKRYYRKKLDEAKTYAAVEKHGDRHHIVFVYQPN